MSLPNSFDPETPSLKCMPLGQVQNKMLVTLILENFVSEGKAFWRLNILVSFLPFQERKGRFKGSHLQVLSLSYAQLPWRLASYKNWGGNITGWGRGVKCLSTPLVMNFQWELLKSHQDTHTHIHTYAWTHFTWCPDYSAAAGEAYAFVHHSSELC